jgi:hypothetical protein
MWFELMSPFHKKVAQWMLVPIVVGMCFSGYQYVKRVLLDDPLTKYQKANPSDLPDTVSLASFDTTFTRFESGNPKSQCFVKKMVVAKNRQMYDFTDISNGSIDWKGKNYAFESQQGQWNGFSKLLDLSGKIRVRSSDFDVISQKATYDELRRTITLPTGVEGTAFDGKLKVVNMVYRMDAESLEFTSGNWSGTPKRDFVQDTPEAIRRWDVDAKGGGKIVKDIGTYNDVRATDGEIIVLAKNMIYDRKLEIVTATGNVRYYGKSSNMISDKVVIYRKERRSVFSGSVTMLIKPKDESENPAKETILVPLPPVEPGAISKKNPPLPDAIDRKQKEEELRSSENLRKYPTILIAKQIEYWYKKGERRAKITGSPQARQELPEKGWRYAWSHEAFYDTEKERLNLFSSKDKKDVIVKNSIGDVFFATEGSLSTKEGDDDFEFKAGNGSFQSDDEDLPPPDKKKNDGGSGRGGGGNPPPRSI